MFRRDPHCYWCGVRTVLDAEGKPNHATVDHLYSKLHPLRPTKHKTGDRTVVLHVLACSGCNGLRGRADTQGRVFIPKLEARREIAEHASAVIGAEVFPEYTATLKKEARLKLARKRPIISEDVRGFGWTDERGDLRPCSYEEYQQHRPAFIGDSFQRPVKLKREPICTIGEAIEYAQSQRANLSCPPFN